MRPFWPIGFVKVANNGTPVCIMNNVDPSNNNSPTASPSPSSPGPEYSVRCVNIEVQGFKPGANNNGMVQNSNNVYLIYGPGNGAGPGNRSDSGQIIKVIAPGADEFVQATDYTGDTQFSPYYFFLDCDTNGDGGQVTLWGVK